MQNSTVRVAAGQLQGTKAMKNLSAILQAFRTDLPNSSLTAQAIDRGALLDEISQVAAMERIHQLAAILFEAEQEETQDNPDKEVDLETLINKQILQLRAKLPDASRTAKAIDRGATLEEISESAQEEGLSNLAATLFEAEQEKGGKQS
jgi:vacuolar-type H+-ATPase catalytic subunit A/Vma1